LAVVAVERALTSSPARLQGADRPPSSVWYRGL